ncbi:MAG: hypothetical protein H6742_17455 [Alphaproteobacteria bacterium]|nr:hypothetical protein [Alphaproteobacteria bacterium]
MSLFLSLLAVCSWLVAPAAGQGLVVDEGALAVVGESLGDAAVVEVRSHPEFERYTVALPDGRQLPLEVTWVREGARPTCQHHALGVFPRWELLAEEGVEVQADPAGAPAAAALCARLDARGEGLVIGPAAASSGDGEASSEGEQSSEGGQREDRGVQLPDARQAPPHPLQWVLVALGVALLAAIAWPVRKGLDRRAVLDAGLVGLLAVLMRWQASPWGLQVAPDAGYERLVLAWGMFLPHPLYGDGFSSLHAALQAATDFDPDAVFALHAGLSAFAPLVLWWLARELLADRAAAVFAGMALAVLPVALRLAASEVAHVPLATFELLAVAGAWGFLSRGSPCLALVGALAAGFAPHLRPEALPFVALPGALLLLGAWRHRRPLPIASAVVALAVIGGLVAWRMAGFPTIRDDGPVHFSDWTRPMTWLRLVMPSWRYPTEARDAYQVFLHAGLTNPLLPALALVGLVRGRRPVVVGALAWWALTLLPVFPKSWPMIDAWRLQLSAQAPLLLLGAAGVAALVRPAVRMQAATLTILLTLFYLPRVREPWAGQAEWQLLREAVSELPADAIVLVPDHEKHGQVVRNVGAQLARRAGVERPNWQAMGPFAADPDPGPDRYAWINLTCRIETLPGMGVANDRTVNSCLQLAERCQLVPAFTTTLPTTTDVDLTLVDPPVEVGFYRIDDCRPAD